MAQHHEPWALAVTALVTVLVKVAREANCDLGKLSSSIRNDISALKPPFANSPAQVVLEKVLERIEDPNASSSLN
jgi:hypothetical protein